ncbi:MAG: hypothetical protein J5713_02615 [Clostridia bacterium]|nr:hypothetical protein [Clostridia bacterium]
MWQALVLEQVLCISLASAVGVWAEIVSRGTKKIEKEKPLFYNFGGFE